MELWQVFKALVDEKGIKIADVSNATGIPYTTVDSIIKKQLKDIKFDNAVKIAEYFGVPVDYLATGVMNQKVKDSSDACAQLAKINLLNEYGVKRLMLYLEGVLLLDKDCLK